MLCGFVSDSVGRKKACFIFSIIASIGLILFSCGARMGWSAVIIGIGWGMFIGTLWSITDTLVLVMPAESTPTSMSRNGFINNSFCYWSEIPWCIFAWYFCLVLMHSAHDNFVCYAFKSRRNKG